VNKLLFVLAFVFFVFALVSRVMGLNTLSATLLAAGLGLLALALLF